MSHPADFRIFDGQKYLSLETYRKSGVGVRTPVWFAADPQGGSPPNLYVYTIGNSGKVKRIRNNPAVKVAPCDMRGNVTGEWVPAIAEVISGDAAQLGMKLLNRKYVPWKQLLDFFARFGRKGRVVFILRPA